MFISQMGKSLRTTSPLTEAMVLQAGADRGSAVSSDTAARLVGAGWKDQLANAFSKVKHIYESSKPIISGVKRALEDSGSSTAGNVAKAMGSVGYGRSHGKGAMSGAALSDRFN
jgi:hypothetical protein